MCLSIPYQIKKINGNKADCNSCQNNKKVINLDILQKVRVGDWILALNGFAVQKIPANEAKKLIEILKTSKKED